MDKVTVCASGFFNPLHKGHICYLESANKLGDYLIVIINNDKQVKLKGSIPFMDENERLLIIKALSCVDDAILSIDEDLSVCQTLISILPSVFVNGGDIIYDRIRERKVCEEYGIRIIIGVGGEKIQSSSTILKQTIENIYKQKNIL